MILHEVLLEESSAQEVQDRSSGSITGVRNSPNITPQNNIFVGENMFDSSIFLKSIARPIEPKIINPTEAKSSNLTKEELM